MLQFEGQGADEVWLKIFNSFQRNEEIIYQQSRLGKTLELLHTGITILDPRQKWILSRFPPINPAFAIAEVIWIMNGRNDADYLNYWNSKLPRFAGNVQHYHGAYGFRLRKHLGIDQLYHAKEVLSRNKNSRQVVLQIWDSKIDLPKKNGDPCSSDIPCNLFSILKIRNNKLEWMQILRSNDFFLGLPYNIIQFTSLQEILAGWIGVEPGSYNQLSDSLHIYESDLGLINRAELSVNSYNSDSLSLPFKYSRLYLKHLDKTIHTILDSAVSEKLLNKLGKWDNAPASFRNLLYVLLAECARKNKLISYSNEIIEKCSNPVLRTAWSQWKEYLSTKHDFAKRNECELSSEI
jgi:thymidylate synthase